MNNVSRPNILIVLSVNSLIVLSAMVYFGNFLAKSNQRLDTVQSTIVKMEQHQQFAAMIINAGLADPHFLSQLTSRDAAIWVALAEEAEENPHISLIKEVGTPVTVSMVSAYNNYDSLICTVVLGTQLWEEGRMVFKPTLAYYISGGHSYKQGTLRMNAAETTTGESLREGKWVAADAHLLEQNKALPKILVEEHLQRRAYALSSSRSRDSLE